MLQLLKRSPVIAGLLTLLFLLGAFALMIQFQSSPAARQSSSSSTPENTEQKSQATRKQPASSAPPPSPKFISDNKDDDNKDSDDNSEQIKNIQKQAEPPRRKTSKETIVSSPSLTSCPSPVASCSSSCPSNRYVDKYFRTDPKALSFKGTAFNNPSTSSHQNQKNSGIDFPVASTKHHTGSGVPVAFKELLYSMIGSSDENNNNNDLIKIDENADKYFGAEKAVNALEKKCDWDGNKGVFTKDPKCLEEIVSSFSSSSSGDANDQQNKKKVIVESALKKFFVPSLSSSLNDDDSFDVITDDEVLAERAPRLIDIVIPSIRDLDFLEKWRHIIEKFHLILIQDGDPQKILKIPPWADYELYNRNDIEATLKDRSWIISQKDASIRNFGFLISKKKYIYTLDDDCLPVTIHHKRNTQQSSSSSSYSELKGDCSSYATSELYNSNKKFSSSSSSSNPILQHLRNLMTPSSPYFFNTLYDGYRKGTDFVRGYPYSMRDGVTTVVSHGLWLNNPDYDAPTQILKPREKNERLSDTVLTVPAGVLYPMCSMNVAFDRKKIGPAFMQGLMGVGQPWARYDDMFAGWASKVVADHLAVGVKSGAPYIFHNKASNPFTNLKKEYKGLWWQEVIIAFCNRVQLPANATTPESAYRALALALRHELLPLHPYFDRLATAMLAWVDAWEGAESGKLIFTPSRSSIKEEQKLTNNANENKKKCSSSSNSDSTSSSSYSQRYSECNSLLRQPSSVRREVFRRAASSGRFPHSNEAVLLHISEEEQRSQRAVRNVTSGKPVSKWSKDLWLSVCSILLEATTKTSLTTTTSSSSSSSVLSSRDVFLFVSGNYAQRLVPREFLHLVRKSSLLASSSSDDHSSSSTVNLVNGKPKEHRDVEAAEFLKTHPVYNFVWSIDSATRYAGQHWGDMLSRVRKVTSSSPSSSSSTSKVVRRAREDFYSIPPNTIDDESRFYEEDLMENSNNNLNDDEDDENDEAPYDDSHTRGNIANKLPHSLRTKSDGQDEAMKAMLPTPTTNKASSGEKMQDDLLKDEMKKDNNNVISEEETTNNNAKFKTLDENGKKPKLFGLTPADSHFIFFTPLVSLKKNENNNDDAVPFVFSSPIFGISRTLAEAILAITSSPASSVSIKSPESQETRLPRLCLQNRLKMTSLFDSSEMQDKIPKQQIYYPTYPNTITSATGNTPRNSYFESCALYSAWKSNIALTKDLFLEGMASSPLFSSSNNNSEEMKEVLEKRASKIFAAGSAIDEKGCLGDFLFYPVR